MTGTPLYTETNFNTVVDSPTYKAQIDANFAVLNTLGAWFAPSPSSPAAMTVKVNAGALFVSGAIVAQAVQTTGTITAPSGSNKRIDRVVINATTGAVSVITGTPTTGTPTAPAITTGNLPCAQIGPLLSSTTTIGTSLVIDERTGPGAAGALPTVVAQDRKTSGTGGSAISASTWTDADLNTLLLNTVPSGVSLSNPNLTLPAGTYDIEVSAMISVTGAETAGQGQIRLFNTTDSATQTDTNSNAMIGQSLGIPSGRSGTSVISGRFTIAASKALKVQRWTDGSAQGGNAASSGAGEMYMTMRLTKVA